MKERVWITHSLERIPVRRMTSRHIENSIEMIKRGYDRLARPASDYRRMMLGRLLREKQRREDRNWLCFFGLLVAGAAVLLYFMISLTAR